MQSAGAAVDRGNGFEFLRTRVLALTGIDLGQYKGTQLDRRLASFLARHGLPDLTALGRLLEKEPRALESFRDFLTINVSEFFRNSDRFEELRRRVLPDLLQGSPTLRIWSAGCSIGAEIYSVAVLLDQLTPGRRHYLLATDIDRLILEKARRAVYGEQDFKAMQTPLRQQYFKEGPGGFHFDRRLAECVEFRYHNMLKDPMPEGMDLILCRNVVIYFTDDAKEQLYRNFQASLRPGGYLFVGGTEMLFNARQIGFQPTSPCFYQKVK